MFRRLAIALLSVSLAISTRSEALAQDADMPRDCLAIATQIQAETHVRFMRGKAVDTLISDPGLASELGSNSISMHCPPSALVPEPQAFYWYVVTVWGQGSDPSKAFYDLVGGAGRILTGEKAETLNQASHLCLQKALKAEFRISGVLTQKATVKCQFDPDVRAPNVSIWKRAPTDVELP